MTRRLPLLRSLLSTTLLTASGLSFASGGDTWSTLSHDQFRSARSTAKGEMSAPQIAWTYSVGGSLAEDQVALADVDGDGVTELVMVSAGKVVAKSATGKTLWSSPNFGALRVVGVYDLNGQPPAEVVAVGESPLGAYILSAADGSQLWYAATVNTSFSLLTVPNGSAYRLLLARQQDILTAYDFASGITSPTTNKLWDSTTSPWSIDMAVADVDGDGKDELIRGRDRGFEVRNMTTGALRCDASNIITGTIEPSYFPAITVADVDGDGREDVILYDYSYYYSEDAGIFVASCNGSSSSLTLQVRWNQQWITDTTPGTGNNVNDKQIRYLADAVANYDAKPGLELVYSLWDASTSSWTTSLVNAATGVPIASKNGEVLEAVADLDDDGMPEALLREATGIGDLPKPYFSKMRLYNLNVGAFHDKGWVLDKGRAATINARRSRLVTSGSGSIGAHQNTDGDLDLAEEVYIFAAGAAQGADDPRPGKLLTVKGTDGTVFHEYDYPAHIHGSLITLAGSLANSGSLAESVVMLSDGGLRTLDANLAEVGKLLPGNFARMPSVVSLDGQKNLVVGMTSPGHLIALDGTLVMTQQPSLVWSFRNAIQPESRGYVNSPGLVIPNNTGPGASLVIRAHKTGAFEEQSLVALDAAGKPTWSADVGTSRKVADFDNYELLDDLDGDGIKDFFLTELEPDGAQQLVVRKGSDGSTMAIRPTADLFPPAGVYLQGHASVDLNGDGKLDIVSPLHGSWFVGIDVSKASTGDPLQAFTQIFRTNAPPNGQAMVGQVDNDTMLDLLRANSQNAFGPYQRRDLAGLIELSFTSPHPATPLTDTNTAALLERPGQPGKQDLVWTGMADAALGAVGRVDGETFSEVWFSYLAEGKVYAKADLPPARAALHSPVVADIDNDGADEVLVGSEDGYLYALRGIDGSLAFSLELGAPVLHLLAADIDKDPQLELLAALANSTWVALDDLGKYSCDSTVSEPQPEAGPEPTVDSGPQPDVVTEGAAGAGGSDGGKEASPEGSAGTAGKAGGSSDAATEGALSEASADGQAEAAPTPGGGGSDDSGGCGCRTATSESIPAPAGMLALLLTLGARRKRRR